MLLEFQILTCTILSGGWTVFEFNWFTHFSFNTQCFFSRKISISALNSSLLVMGMDFGKYVIDLFNIHQELCLVEMDTQLVYGLPLLAKPALWQLHAIVIIVICLPTEHLGVFKNSLKRVHAFHIELEFGSAGFQGKGKTVLPWEKPLGARKRTNNKLNPHMVLTPGFEPGPHEPPHQ